MGKVQCALIIERLFDAFNREKTDSALVKGMVLKTQPREPRPAARQAGFPRLERDVYCLPYSVPRM